MLGTVLGARDIAVNKRVKSLPLEHYILVGKINKIERMSADDKYDEEIKSGKGGRELGVRGTCYFSKVVRQGLTEKVTLEKILEGNEGANHWMCGGKVFQGTTSARALGQEYDTDLERNIHIQRQTCGNMMTWR